MLFKSKISFSVLPAELYTCFKSLYKSIAIHQTLDMDSVLRIINFLKNSDEFVNNANNVVTGFTIIFRRISKKDPNFMSNGITYWMAIAALHFIMINHYSYDQSIKWVHENPTMNEDGTWQDWDMILIKRKRNDSLITCTYLKALFPTK